MSLGLVVGQEPITFTLPEFVSYLGERVVLKMAVMTLSISDKQLWSYQGHKVLIWRKQD